jgi:hypothetical protein
VSPKRRLCDVFGMALLSHIPRFLVLAYLRILPLCEFDDEEPKPGTIGKGRSRTAAMPRLAASIHAERPAEILDKGRTACRGDAPTQCLEELIRLRVDRCYRENGPSRLVRILAPAAAHQNLATSLSAYSPTVPGNALWVSAVPSNVAYRGVKWKKCAPSEVYSLF